MGHWSLLFSVVCIDHLHTVLFVCCCFVVIFIVVLLFFPIAWVLRLRLHVDHLPLVRTAAISDEAITTWLLDFHVYLPQGQSFSLRTFASTQRRKEEGRTQKGTRSLQALRTSTSSVPLSQSWGTSLSTMHLGQHIEPTALWLGWTSPLRLLDFS